MNIGFIGCGNMASAILLGGLNAGFLHPQTTWVCDVLPEKVRAIQEKTGVHSTDNLSQLAASCDVLLMAVKPNVVEAVIAQLGDALVGKAIISIAAGWSFQRYSACLPAGTRCVFVMPNTPCMVGQGMALIETENSLTAEELEFTKALFSSFGKAEMMPPYLMDAAGTLSGCGPAFIYMVIEGLADGAVYHGVPRDVAYRLAAQMVVGAGQMVLESGLHPGTLKDNVCSPGGTTIRGVRALERGGLRALCMDAIDRPLHDKE